MIEADKEGRAQDALAIAAGLNPFAQAAYAADPGSQHAIWNDYGALLYEHGDRDFAISVLRSAWAAHQAWTQSDDRRDGIKTKQQVGLLNTLGTLVSALTSVGDFDDAEQFRQLGASTAFDLSIQGYNEAYTFLIAGGQLLAAQGRTGEAENVLTKHLRAAEVLPALRMPLFRVAMFLASIYVRRRRFDLARQSLERAGQLIDSARFVQDAADLQQAWAVLWHKLSADDIQSAAWRNAAAANQEASRLRASSPRVSPSAGCAEEALFAIMALKENRIVEGRRYLARALRLARTVWTLDDLANPLLTSAGFALVAGRPAKALSRTRRLIRRLHPHEAGDREALLTVLPVHAEALRRLGHLAGAANALEYVLDIESDLVTAAIVPNWSPHDVALVRRGHETLNLFVDAALAAGAMRDPHQLFARIAATKDLGLQTLRMKRGAAPPELKRSTLADDLARALPKGAGYVEFFIHTPRLPGGLRTTWGPVRLLAFTLHGRGRTSLKLHDLGPATPSPSRWLGSPRPVRESGAVCWLRPQRSSSR